MSSSRWSGRVRLLRGWVVVAALVAATVSPARAAPLAPKPAAGPKKVDPKSVDALLKQGREYLAAGEYAAARDAFSDVVSTDSKNVEALHGLGLAYMYLNDFAHAREPMEKALVANPAPNRALVLNMAVCQIGVRNPMRAAKVLMDYLSAHPKDLDEPLCNALGTALNVADDQAKKGGMFASAQQFYVTYNAKLEAAKPGLKRWGVQWMKAADVDAKLTANGAAQKQLAAIGKDLAAYNAKVRQQQAEVDKAKDQVRRGNLDMQYELEQRAALLKGFEEERDAKQAEYDAEAAKVESPTFPRSMSLVAMDDLTPPPVAANAVIVEATPPSPEPTIKAVAPKPKPKPKPATPADANKGNSTKTDTTDPKADEPPPISVAAKPAAHKKVRVSVYAAAFPVGEDLVVTTANAVAGATDIGLQTADGSSIQATLVRADEATGLALLRTTGRKLAPMALATAPFNGGPVQCSAYATVNIFNPSAELLPGTAKPLAPGGGPWHVALSRHPRLGGAPLLVSGKVVGVELAARESAIGDIPAATLDQLKAFLAGDYAATSGPNADPVDGMLQLIATRETAGD